MDTPIFLSYFLSRTLTIHGLRKTSDPLTHHPSASATNFGSPLPSLPGSGSGDITVIAPSPTLPFSPPTVLTQRKLSPGEIHRHNSALAPPRLKAAGKSHSYVAREAAILDAWLRAWQLPPAMVGEPQGAQPRSGPLIYSRSLLQQPSPLLWTTLINAQHVVNTLVLTPLLQLSYISPLYNEIPVIQRGSVLSSHGLLELHPHHLTVTSLVRVTSGSYGSIRLFSVLALHDLQQQSTQSTPSAPTHTMLP